MKCTWKLHFAFAIICKTVLATHITTKTVTSTKTVASFVSTTIHLTTTLTKTVSLTVTSTTTVASFVPTSVYVTTTLMTERLSSCPSSVLTLPIITSTCITNVTSTSTLTHWTSTNVTIKEVEERAQEFVKNLTIDSKNTSAYFRSKTSAKDDRPSAMHMGLVGIVVVVVPMVLIILVDLKKIVLDIRSYDNLFKK